MKTRYLVETPIEDLTFSIVDTETTGMHSRFNRIIDIGIVQIRGGEVIDKWEALINPEQAIPFWITGYTSITDSDVINEPVFSEFDKKISEMLEGTIFVGHNVGFDYAFMKHEFGRVGKEFDPPRLCTVKLGRKLMPELSNAHLDMFINYFNLEISKRHRALPDAEATAFILNHFIDIAQNKYSAKNFFDLERLQWLKVKRGPQVEEPLL